MALGEVPEWLKGAVLKTAEAFASVGSNPTLSADEVSRAVQPRPRRW